MKPFIITALLALVLVCIASSQTPKPLRISKYMRDIGLVYLEEVERLPLICGDETVVSTAPNGITT